MTKLEARVAGSEHAEKMSVVSWGICGFFAPALALPVVYLRSPKITSSVLLAHEDDPTTRYFESQYLETLKSRQVKATWAGALIAIFFFYVFFVLVASA